MSWLLRVRNYLVLSTAIVIGANFVAHAFSRGPVLGVSLFTEGGVAPYVLGVAVVG